jgi:hypothetical protein
MQREHEQTSTHIEVERTIEQHIQKRTNRRVGDLHVEARDDRVVVLRGWTRTYYLKQLAQVAAQELLGSGRMLVNDIQVPSGEEPHS